MVNELGPMISKHLENLFSLNRNIVSLETVRIVEGV